MRKYIIFIIGVLCLFIGTYFYAKSYFNYESEDTLGESVEKKDNVQQTNTDELKIGRNCLFIKNSYYSKCNHYHREVDKVDNEMINLTKELFEQKYPKYIIKKFTKDVVEVDENELGICEEHFVIGLGEDFVEVFRLDSNSEEELYLVTNISKEYLTEDDIKKLDNGIEVVGKENVNSKLEDYE